MLKCVEEVKKQAESLGAKLDKNRVGDGYIIVDAPRGCVFAVDNSTTLMVMGATNSQTFWAEGCKEMMNLLSFGTRPRTPEEIALAGFRPHRATGRAVRGSKRRMDMGKQRSECHLGPNTRHTPGPWEVSQSTGNIWAGSGKWNVGRVYVGGMDRNEADANARLIAAAPDLLAACEQVWKVREEGRDLDNIDFMGILDAIRKAGGEA